MASSSPSRSRLASSWRRQAGLPLHLSQVLRRVQRCAAATSPPVRDQDVGRSLVALLPVVPPVSPALAAAEGHQDRRSIPSVNGESAERSARLPHLLMSVGRLSQGGQWPMCFPSGGPLAVVCSSERKGLGSTREHHEQQSRASARPTSESARDGRM